MNRAALRGVEVKGEGVEEMHDRPGVLTYLCGGRILFGVPVLPSALERTSALEWL